MVFSSPVFLFLFLPVVLTVYFAFAKLGRVVQNGVLLLASLFFYAWGEQEIVAIMVLSIAVNYVFGLWVDRVRERKVAKLAIGLAVAFNLGLLVFFKYTNWIWAGVRSTFASFGGEDLVPEVETIGLPIGISFFTFQAMSYVLDVYRRDGGVQRNPINFAVYIALFPQLIAGPIVRYRDIAQQIVERSVGTALFASGVRRFLIGLGKKMLVANIVAEPADRIFDIPHDQLSTPVAWLGIVCYTLQIYFDFSGYSDMAIGLGRMFGFKFLENFNFPYISQSITEFWRRWHISLSSWFRDYLYIPLGGNRRGSGRTLFNLLIVFFLCGMWHGAAWNFVVWGLFHGGFLVVERVGLKKVVDRVPRPLRHGYVLLVVIIGWVFFRAPDLSSATLFLGRMFGLSEPVGPAYFPGLYLNNVLKLALVAGFLGSVPWLPKLLAWRGTLEKQGESAGTVLLLDIAGLLLLSLVLLLSAMELSAGTYNPFIYFRF